jgi:Domain of unknown function (DUF4263)
VIWFVSIDLEWRRLLFHRQGAADRLDGIDVYYDFEWDDHFPDQRAQFRHGKALALFVRKTCPEGKTPALLLTADEEADEGFQETPKHCVCVLHLPSYREAEANPCLAYLAAKLGAGIAKIGPLSPGVAEHAAVGAKAAESGMDIEKIAAWAGRDEDRLAQLRQLAGTGSGAEVDDVLEALASLGDELDPELVRGVADLFGKEANREKRLELLRELTGDPSGRHLTGLVLAERVGQRIDDARGALEKYEAVLADPQSSETDLQRFIEENVWLLGLQYVKARPRHDIPRGAADFILERVDGFHDLLELKSPQDVIVKGPDASDGKPPSASAYELSRSLAKALAQVHVYRDTLSADEQTIERQFGLSESRDPRLIIVLGKAEFLDANRRRVLRELNKSLHRVEVMPYDILGKRAEVMLDNVEKYLLVAERESAEE